MKDFAWKSFEGTTLLPDTLISYWLHVCMFVRKQQLSNSSHFILPRSPVGEGDGCEMIPNNVIHYSSDVTALMLAHTYTHMWTNAYVENLNNSNYCDINMALFFFFSVKVNNSTFFHPDVKNPKHLASAGLNSWETLGRVGGGLWGGQGGSLSSGGFQPFVVVPGQQPALCRSDTVLKHKDLLPLEELPVSSCIRTKISTSFQQKKKKKTVRGSRCKSKKSRVRLQVGNHDLQLFEQEEFFYFVLRCDDILSPSPCSPSKVHRVLLGYC